MTAGIMSLKSASLCYVNEMSVAHEEGSVCIVFLPNCQLSR